MALTKQMFIVNISNVDHLNRHLISKPKEHHIPAVAVLLCLVHS